MIPHERNAAVTRCFGSERMRHCLVGQSLNMGTKTTRDPCYTMSVGFGIDLAGR